MTGDDSAPAPDPVEYLERVQWHSFRRACATMRLHDALQKRIWAYRHPHEEALGWIPDEGGSAELAGWLAGADAECAVYVHESPGPWPPTGRGLDAGRLVVAAAVWPREGLSGLRIAAYGRDGSLDEVTTDGVRLEDTHLDVPWLRSCLPGPVVPRWAPEPAPRRALDRWRRAAAGRFDWL
ncbi:hypothetical protein OHS33_16060 [Streptomyces sp. NBC_00536]|uniref:hypothetical protein n=1 Tax=Streptomyces sp. NBC_00536 TaxID=2975769 RepID=UPI002E800DD3|nr:hypothetical protein [Streptomyces sp. NBC_00536]WUC79711.1 hypothetical protein OHS33_16060 [Streptomyces sp. NBC_00536]